MVTEPSGATHNDPIDLVNETNSWPVGLPGVWRFRFEDAGCMSAFDVEVRL